MSWWFESDFEKQTRTTLEKIYKGVITMSQVIDGLKAQVATLVTNVAANTDVVASATAAITGMTDQLALLTQQLQEAIDANDPEAIQEAADAIAGQNAAIVEATSNLAAAIPANTVK